jgi:hypothetical protein
MVTAALEEVQDIPLELSKYLAELLYDLLELDQSKGTLSSTYCGTLDKMSVLSNLNAW